MLKYVNLINEETGLCSVGLGNDSAFYEKLGMYQMEVTQSLIDNQWYLTEKLNTQEYISALLEKAKQAKHDENKRKRDEFLNSGVLYKGVKFDSDTDSKVNIMGALSSLPDDAVVGWNSMDNETVILTKAELNELGNLLVELTSKVWGENGLNVQFINAINEAQTLEELNAVVIDYTNEQGVNENE